MSGCPSPLKSAVAMPLAAVDGKGDAVGREAAGGLAQQHGHGAGEVARRGDVGPPIAVEVRARHPDRPVPDGDRRALLREAAGGLAQQDGDRVGFEAREGEVGPPVAVEVGRHDPLRRGSDRDRRALLHEAAGGLADRTDTDALPRFVTATSGRPSPLKSAAATARGLAPVAGADPPPRSRP